MRQKPRKRDVGLLRRALLSRTVADLRSRTIAGSVLVDLLHEAATPGPRHLRLRRAVVTGGLPLQDLLFPGPLEFEDCVIQGPLDLSRATIGSLTISGGSVGQNDGAASIDLRSADVAHGIDLSGVHIDGHIVMAWATSRGPVQIGAGTLVGVDGDGDAIWADGLTTEGDLFLRGPGTKLAGAIRLTGAHIGGAVSIRSHVRIGADSRGYSLTADQVETTEGIVIGDASHLAGGLRSRGAAIGGQVVVDGGTQVGASEGVSIDLTSTGASDVLVGGSTGMPMAITGLAGALQLQSAHIAALRLRPPVCLGADLRGNSIDAARAKVTGDLRLARKVGGGEEIPAYGRVELAGTVDLSDAAIGGSLSIRHGTAIGLGDAHIGQAPEVPPMAIEAPGLEVTRDLDIDGDGTSLQGSVNLGGASIGGRLAIGDNGGQAVFARHRSGDRQGLRAHRLDVRGATLGTLSLTHDTGLAHIDLRSCHTDQLEDRPGCWGLHDDDRHGHLHHRIFWRLWPRRRRSKGFYPRSRRHAWRHGPDHTTVELGDLTVKQLPDDASFEKAARPAWLRHTVDPHTRKVTPAGESTYREFAGVLAAGGDDDGARTLLAEMKRRHRGPVRRFLWGFIDQGYRPWRALYALVALIVVVALLSDYAADNGALVPGADPPCESVVCLGPLYYAIDTVIPVLNLGDSKAWQPSPEGTWPVRGLRFSLVLARILGTALTGLFLVGATGRILDRRDHM